MKKVKVTTERLIQQLFPFMGKIRFTLKGNVRNVMTSFIPDESIFCKGKAISLLVPNSLIENVDTYYQYEIFPQGHKPGFYLSEPVEKGVCIVPDYDCNLADIATPSINMEVMNQPDYYTVENTNPTEVDKVVTVKGNFALVAGAIVFVKFLKGWNKIDNRTLKVNNTIAAKIGNSNLIINSNQVIMFIYDGSYWRSLSFT